MKPDTTLPSVAETAVTLADALRASPVFARFQEAEHAVAEDAELQQKLAAYRTLAIRVRGYQRHGREFDGAEAIRFGTLQAELSTNPLLTAREEAMADLVALLTETNQTISERLGVDFATNAAPRSGCCG